MDTALAQRIIKARSGHGWSQADLAEVSGIAAAQISRYEQGRNVPRPPVVAKLASALAVSFEWLAYGEGEPENGSQVPSHPRSQILFEALELDDDLFKKLQSFASSSGLTMEMAAKQAFLAGLKSYEARHPDLLKKSPPRDSVMPTLKHQKKPSTS